MSPLLDCMARDSAIGTCPLKKKLMRQSTAKSPQKDQSSSRSAALISAAKAANCTTRGTRDGRT